MERHKTAALSSVPGVAAPWRDTMNRKSGKTFFPAMAQRRKAIVLRRLTIYVLTGFPR
jgi:hypothetical protein